MKLIGKTMLYYTLISVPLLLVAILFSYRLIRSELRDGTEEDLQKEKQNAQKLIRSSHELKNLYLSFDSLASIKQTESTIGEELYSDTLLYDRDAKEFVGYRMLRAPYHTGKRSYLITVLRPTLEEEELMEGLLSAFAIIIGFLVLSFFIVNWIIAKTLWKPFHVTLGKLNAYDIRNHEKHTFSPAKITEFDQLNTALNKMTEKIHGDFIQQKEFTENASHEMQTPLAVIKANLSLLLQSPRLEEEEMNRLQAIENTTRKLGALNKALILLSKIENNQFKESESIHLKTMVVKNLEHFSELLQARNIAISPDLKSNSFVKASPALVDILVGNLLQNAIRHNREGGSILLSLEDRLLVIANSGESLSIDPTDLFVRFKKNDASRESLGLGLSIAKSIADHYGYKMTYSYVNSLHTFTCLF